MEGCPSGTRALAIPPDMVPTGTFVKLGEALRMLPIMWDTEISVWRRSAPLPAAHVF